MNKHTPGPWVVGATTNHGQCVYIDAPKGDAGLCYSSWSGIACAYGSDDDKEVGREIAAANARIIAAAPELLEELEETHAALCFTSDYIGTLRYERNKSAIAKARGEA